MTCSAARKFILNRGAGNKLYSNKTKLAEQSGGNFLEDLLVRAPIRDIFTLYILHLFTFPAVGVNLMRTIDVYDG